MDPRAGAIGLDCRLVAVSFGFSDFDRAHERVVSLWRTSAVLTVDHVSKKFCRGLRRSLWYGLKDLVAELAAQDGNHRLRLRPLEFLAVDDVSFSLERGECVGLLGANGAGKSTLLKMLNGLIRPDAGCIEIQGRMQGLIELGTGFSPVLTGP